MELDLAIRGGTVVTASGDVRREAARVAADQYVTKTRSLGLAPDEILALVRAQLAN